MALTAKQELFCRLISEGKRQSEAYKMAYNCEKMLPATIDNNAYMLSKKSDIVARIKELQDELKEKSQITVEKMIKELKEIEALARQPIHGKDKNDFDLTNWIKVKQEIIKLTGLYAPTKTENKNENIDLTTVLNELKDATDVN